MCSTKAKMYTVHLAKSSSKFQFSELARLTIDKTIELPVVRLTIPLLCIRNKRVKTSASSETFDFSSRAALVPRRDI